jgi:ribosomal protein S18 acetylase RimI-like enzyme
MMDYLAQAKVDFDYEPDWWAVAHDSAGAAVGFVLPVLFRDGRNDQGRPEGTIYHMGVVPEHRGHGYGRDLLLRATETLQNAGVWRILCDTDIRNTAMIQTFRNAGFAQAGETYTRPL